MTPARLASIRHHAQKSTGPRTARGKAQSRLNGLRHRFCLPAYRQFWLALINAPPCYPVAKTVVAMLTPAEYCNPVDADLIDMQFEMEREDRVDTQRTRRRRPKADIARSERSLEPIENKGRGKTGTPQS
jgi:hypothetical protein